MIFTEAANLVAFAAVPFNEAVIMPALKSPEAFLATILSGVFETVASTLIVIEPSPFAIIILSSVPVNHDFTRVFPVVLPIKIWPLV